MGHVQFAYAPDGQSRGRPGPEVRDEIVSGEGREVYSWTNLYDARTGREIRRFEGNGTANCLAFSPDGQVLAGAVLHRREARHHPVGCRLRPCDPRIELLTDAPLQRWRSCPTEKS